MSPKKKEIPWWVIPLTAVGVFALFVASWKLLPAFLPNATLHSDRANLLNALFAALAFGGVIAAIIMQKRELELQREELDETQELLKKQSDAMNDQVAMLQRQSFENTFFQMVRLFQERDKDILGKMNAIHAELEFAYRNHKERQPKVYEWQESVAQMHARMRGLIENFYTEVYRRHERELGPYFRMLYHIVRFVDESTSTDKVRYVNVVRAQLSDAELRVMFYNGLSPFAEHFTPLMEKYRLLKHLDTSVLFEPDFKVLYAPRTFAEEDALWVPERPVPD